MKRKTVVVKGLILCKFSFYNVVTDNMCFSPVSELLINKKSPPFTFLLAPKSVLKMQLWKSDLCDVKKGDSQVSDNTSARR